MTPIFKAALIALAEPERWMELRNGVAVVRSATEIFDAFPVAIFYRAHCFSPKDSDGRIHMNNRLRKMLDEQDRKDQKRADKLAKKQALQEKQQAAQGNIFGGAK
jgi:hypothetical protein